MKISNFLSKKKKKKKTQKRQKKNNEEELTSVPRPSFHSTSPSPRRSPDHHRGVGASQPVRVHLAGAVGRAAGRAVLPHGLGRAGGRVGGHHGLPDGRAGAVRLRPGHGRPAAGQAERAEGEEAERARWGEGRGSHSTAQYSTVQHSTGWFIYPASSSLNGSGVQLQTENLDQQTLDGQERISILKVRSHQTRRGDTIPYKVYVQTQIWRIIARENRRQNVSRQTFALHRQASSQGFVAWQICWSWNISILPRHSCDDSQSAFNSVATEWHV